MLVIVISTIDKLNLKKKYIKTERVNCLSNFQFKFFPAMKNFVFKFLLSVSAYQYNYLKIPLVVSIRKKTDKQTYKL